MSYRDMTFCIDAPYCKNRYNCDRYFSETEQKKADLWMKDPIVAFSNFADSCAYYVYDDGKECA